MSRIEGINPWLSIWFYPRKTIRAIVDFDPKYIVALLASLTGIFRFLEQASKRSWGDTTSLVWILSLGVMVGTLLGILSVQLVGSYYRWVGSWFGGKATSDEVRASFAWSSIPDVFLLLMLIILISILGEDWFLSDMNPGLKSTILPWILLILLPFGIISLVWRAVLFILCFAEVNHFSFWRATAAILIGLSTIIIPATLLILGRVYLPI